MANQVFVKFEEINELDVTGKVKNHYFAVRIFDDYDEVEAESADTFKHLTINKENVIHHIFQYYHDKFWSTVELAKGLNFCGEFFNLEELGYEERLEEVLG
jgi:hypothetical protein